ITDNSNNVAGSVQNVPLTGNGSIVANNDATSVLAPGTIGAVSTPTAGFNVRGNDAPANAGIVTITSSSFTNGGATAVASVNANNAVVWTTTGVGATAPARAVSRRGTYTVVYTLTNGTETATATY